MGSLFRHVGTPLRPWFKPRLSVHAPWNWGRECEHLLEGAVNEDEEVVEITALTQQVHTLE